MRKTSLIVVDAHRSIFFVRRRTVNIRRCSLIVSNIVVMLYVLLIIVTFVYYYYWNTDQYFEFCNTDFIIYIFSAVCKINDTSLKSINLVEIKLLVLGWKGKELRHTCFIPIFKCGQGQ